MSVQAPPVFTVLNTWPEPKPETVTNAVAGSVRLTVMPVMLRFGSPAEMSVHDAPSFVLTCKLPPLDPT